jgi:hypothetical protein
MGTIAPDGKAINQNAVPAALADRLGGNDHGNCAALRADITAPHQKGASIFCQHTAIARTAQFAIRAAAFSR